MTEYLVPVYNKFAWQETVIDKDLTAPPGGESKGDRYIVATGGSGAWSGQDGNIAYYNGVGWNFIVKKAGMVVYVVDENANYQYVTSWVLIGTPSAIASAITTSIKNAYNIIILAFKLAIQSSLTIFKMIDGFIDEYEDESGIDTGSSLNEFYNSSDDYYSPDYQIDSNMVVQYKLNDNAASSTVIDSSNNTVNGTYKDVATGEINTSTGSVAGKINTALDFDGDEYINTNQTFQSIFRSSFSISFWMKPADGRPASIQYPFGTQDTDVPISRTITQLRTDGVLLFQYRSNNVIAEVRTANPVFADGAETWHHIVFIADSTVGGIGGLKIYLDNVLQTADVSYQGDTTGINFGLWTSDLNFPIAAVNTNSDLSQFFIGSIDDFRIYSKVLSADEIAALYNSGNGTESPIQGIRGNITLISNAVTAEVQPETARIVVLEEDIDAVTINTDFKSYISRDGTNWSEVTLSDEGDFDASKRVLVGSVDISGQPAGTTMKYKHVSANNKDLKIHATGLLWD